MYWGKNTSKQGVKHGVQQIIHSRKLLLGSPYKGICNPEFSGLKVEHLLIVYTRGFQRGSKGPPEVFEEVPGGRRRKGETFIFSIIPPSDRMRG